MPRSEVQQVAATNSISHVFKFLRVCYLWDNQPNSSAAIAVQRADHALDCKRALRAGV
jgi:hypothetical protein